MVVKITWISVKERTPNSNESICFVFNGKEILEDVHFDRSDNQWFIENSLGYYIEVPGITHWMPFPTAPKLEI